MVVVVDGFGNSPVLRQEDAYSAPTPTPPAPTAKTTTATSSTMDPAGTSDKARFTLGDPDTDQDSGPDHSRRVQLQGKVAALAAKQGAWAKLSPAEKVKVGSLAPAARAPSRDAGRRVAGGAVDVARRWRVRVARVCSAALTPATSLPPAQFITASLNALKTMPLTEHYQWGCDATKVCSPPRACLP